MPQPGAPAGPVRLEGLGTPGAGQAAPGAVRMPMVMMQTATPPKLPGLQAPQLFAPLEVQEHLAAKERQLEELSRYAAALQHELATERARAPRTPSGAQEVIATDPVAELQRFREIAAATAAEGASVASDFARAAEIAQQLNGWFVANAAKMRTQDDRASPSAHLEAVTAALRQQMQGVASRWAQMQAVLAAELPDQPQAAATAAPGVLLPVQQQQQQVAAAPVVAAAQVQPGVLRSASSSHYGSSTAVQAAPSVAQGSSVSVQAAMVHGSSVSVQAPVYVAAPGSDQLSASMPGSMGAPLARPAAAALAASRVTTSAAVAVPVAPPGQSSTVPSQAGQVSYTGVTDASWAPASPRNSSAELGPAGVAEASWAPASPNSVAASKAQSMPWPGSADPFASAYDNMDDDLTPMNAADDDEPGPDQYMSMRVGPV